jgi:DNA-binding CsgD family transcriptional regulator
MNNFSVWQDHRTGPGILILSSTGDIEYLNATAHALIQERLRPMDNGGSDHLPPAVMRVAGSIQTLAMSDGEKDWERLEISEVAGSQDLVLIRGFGLPSGKAGTRIRVLLLLEAIDRYARPSGRIKARFQLTDREQMIVEGLATGRTNKEIAADLSIREPTVKAHIRNIMGKTRCSTRTAVVALLLPSEDKGQCPSIARQPSKERGEKRCDGPE